MQEVWGSYICLGRVRGLAQYFNLSFFVKKVTCSRAVLLETERSHSQIDASELSAIYSNGHGFVDERLVQSRE